MKFEPDTVKGFQDILPPESLKRAAVKEIIEKWFRLYGFVPIETPVIEFDELMRSNSLPSEGEDSAVSERFRLQDRGKRNLGLRYEFTFQLARIFKQYPNIKLPFRRYQIGEVFRDEPVSQKRFRQFTQCDIDIVGDPTIKADAECLAIFADILKELKVESFEIQANNRSLLNSIIESVEIKQIKEVMRELDKVEKLGIDAVKVNLKKHTTTNQITTLFKLLEKPLEFFKENAFQGFMELNELVEACKIYGIKLKFNPLLARGLSYYTGNIFEIKDLENKSSIAGGGRYDKTVGKYSNRDIPAVGISFGLERITELAKIPALQIPKTIIISLNQDEEALALARKLRANEIPCLIEYGKPSKALEYANSQKINYIIFIGDLEVTKKKYKLKNLETGNEALLSELQVLKVLDK